jgi:hypothetical protein
LLLLLLLQSGKLLGQCGLPVLLLLLLLLVMVVGENRRWGLYLNLAKFIYLNINLWFMFYRKIKP